MARKDSKLAYRHCKDVAYIAVISVLVAILIYKNPNNSHRRAGDTKQLLWIGVCPPQDCNSSVSSPTTAKHRPPTLAQALRSLHWDLLVDGHEDNLIDFSGQLLIAASEYAALEPPTAINASCGPPKLPEVTAETCQQYPNVFLPALRSQPAVVGHLIQFGYDVDSLEIHLNELYDVVDYFFITESARNHHCLLTQPKPLMWERVKYQQRFRRFLPKIVHFVVDSADIIEGGGGLDFEINPNCSRSTEGKTGINLGSEAWKIETFQEKLRWQKFKQWNQAAKVFGNSDILGFGDTDEIASRANVHLLKHCMWHEGLGHVDIGIWYPVGSIDRASNFTRHHVPNHSFTLGDPTYWTVEAALKSGLPNRMKGKSPAYLLGGMHLSFYGYLPYQIIKRMTATEYGLNNNKEKYMGLKLLNSIRDAVRDGGNIIKLEDNLAIPFGRFQNNIFDIDETDDDMKSIAIFPWFYDCNRQRYPRWQGLPDPRTYVQQSIKL